MRHAPYEQWVQFTSDVLKKFQLEPKHIVDLGCGTGEITLRLATLGYQITGVDISEDMLAIADEKARKAKVIIPFIQQDIRKLTGFSNVDVFISYCDVLNYLTTEEELMNVFQHVYNALRTGGLFIFDIHNIYYAENSLTNRTYADVTDEVAYIWQCHQGQAAGEMFHEMHFFTKTSDDLYTHFVEEHHQRTFPVQTYETLLKECTFSQITVVSDFQLNSPFAEKYSERNFIIAQK